MRDSEVRHFSDYYGNLINGLSLCTLVAGASQEKIALYSQLMLQNVNQIIMSCEEDIAALAPDDVLHGMFENMLEEARTFKDKLKTQSLDNDSAKPLMDIYYQVLAEIKAGKGEE